MDRTEHDHGNWDETYSSWYNNPSDKNVLPTIIRGEVNYEQLKNFLIDKTDEAKTIGELIKIVSFGNYLMRHHVFWQAIMNFLDLWIHRILKWLENYSKKLNGVLFHIEVGFTTIRLSITFQVNEISTTNTPPRQINNP